MGENIRGKRDGIRIAPLLNAKDQSRLTEEESVWKFLYKSPRMTFA